MNTNTTAAPTAEWMRAALEMMESAADRGPEVFGRAVRLDADYAAAVSRAGDPDA